VELACSYTLQDDVVTLRSMRCIQIERVRNSYGDWNTFVLI